MRHREFQTPFRSFKDVEFVVVMLDRDVRLLCCQIFAGDLRRIQQPLPQHGFGLFEIELLLGDVLLATENGRHIHDPQRFFDAQILRRGSAHFRRLPGGRLFRRRGFGDLNSGHRLEFLRCAFSCMSGVVNWPTCRWRKF